MPNRLQHEISPYLLQHAHNPVDWYPWGEEAFNRAEAESKPVLVSIGYAACHWCHVMERESFEDPAVASFMNAHFICVKVDREEHPDVDHLYMDALQAMTGAGGWPLNMFVTPDRKPFYGGTYFPPRSLYGRSSWMEVLGALHRAWLEQQDAIKQQSDQMLEHLRQASLVASVPAGVLNITPQFTDQVAANLLQQADTEHGGFGGAPKFPASGAIQFLLEYSHFNKDRNPERAAKALQQALLSLDKMIGGGIYDQVGGGFARYATDKEWLVPHFEKMLYDNALLIAVLSTAYRITGQERYRETIEDTLAFCRRELQSEGMPAFWCALDADSEGVEGKFYTWTHEEWLNIRPAIHPAVTAFYGVTGEGNWEETNILQEAIPEALVLKQFSLTEAEWKTILSDTRRQLLTERASRIRPATDDKILLSWNALMNIALTDAGIALGANDVLAEAIQHMDWLLKAFRNEDGSCLHVYKQGQVRIPAKLDDYAYLVKALWKLAAATGEARYLDDAAGLMDYTTTHFLHEDGNFYYFSGDYQNDILVRKVELYDGATPSANAVMQENLWVMGNLMERSAWLEQSDAMMAVQQQSILRYPTSFAQWAVFLQRMAAGRKQLLICGSDAGSYLEAWNKAYHPEIDVMALKEEKTALPAAGNKFKRDRTLLYLCEQFSCKAPVGSLAALDELLQKR